MNVSETRISDVFNLVKKISRFRRLFVALAFKAFLLQVNRKSLV